MSGDGGSGVPNDRLIAVLDGGDGHQETVMVEDEQNNPVAYEAYLERLRAEADAQDKANRLRVAQEQLCEYAQQKERDAAELEATAVAVHESLAAALSDGDVGASAAGMEALRVLRERVAEAAAEARAFAAQQKADVETLKRTPTQAQLSTADGDVEMKRARENGEATETSEEGGQARADDSVHAGAGGAVAGASAADAADGGDDDDTSMGSSVGAPDSSHNWAERARYIPMRLGQDERRLLRLLEAALNVSEYTDRVDILSWRSKNARITQQIKDICAILSGLLVAQDYRRGQELVRDRDFADNKAFFQAVFEAGRRYKVMNPDKMRSEYGKLMYLLMDSADAHVQELLGFCCVAPMRTVYATLESAGALQLLSDPAIATATAEIVAGDRPRYEVQRDIKAKERARDSLAKRYRSNLPEEEVLQCIYALSDNNSYLLFNRDPIDRMIQYVTTYFRPDSFEPGCSLAIQGGREGARLTHNHERQYAYVLQSLTLWREISTEMFRLWYLAEQDMLLNGSGYRLVDTGQGLNRVQGAPRLSKAMQGILARCQQRIGSWVGSSVVHLGDHNVPNALHFIDKYTQVPRILNPVVLVMDTLPKLGRDPNIAAYLSSIFGSVEGARSAILLDFCRHAFNGSGADNFFDAGSCIDGRLTSAWNWCSKLEKKNYFPVFKLAGFTSFDGDFK